MPSTKKMIPRITAKRFITLTLSQPVRAAMWNTGDKRRTQTFERGGERIEEREERWRHVKCCSTAGNVPSVFRLMERNGLMRLWKWQNPDVHRYGGHATLIVFTAYWGRSQQDLSCGKGQIEASRGKTRLPDQSMRRQGL